MSTARMKGVLRIASGTVIGTTTGVSLGSAAGAVGAAIIGDSIAEIAKMKAAGGAIVGGLTGLVMAGGIHAYYREKISTPVDKVMGSGPGSAGPVPFGFFILFMGAALEFLSDMIGYAIFMHDDSLSFGRAMLNMAAGTGIFVVPIAIVTCAILMCGKDGLEYLFDMMTSKLRTSDSSQQPVEEPQQESSVKVNM